MCRHKASFQRPLFALAIFVAALRSDAQITSPLPILPPLPYPPSISISAGVQDLAVDNFQGENFNSVQAAATIQLEDNEGQPYDWGGEASIHATGGASPALRSSGTSLGGGSVSGNGWLNYLFEVRPLNEAIQAAGPIPLVIFATAGSSVSTGSSSTDGTFQAEARVNGNAFGFYALEISNGTVISQVDDFPGTYTLSVPASSLNNLKLQLWSGIGDDSPHESSSFEAFVDPFMYVDPEATFEHEGETLRYIDHYGIAYSPGVEQWQPAITIIEDGFE